MKKKLISRILLGFPLGIAIGHVIEILLSVGFCSFHPCVPAFVERIGSETGAIALQALLCGAMGAVWAGASVIWETDWSLTKQTIVHFLIGACTTLPIAYLLHWMDHTLGGFLRYLLIFAVIFASIWIASYFSWKARLKKMNQKLQEK